MRYLRITQPEGTSPKMRNVILFACFIFMLPATAHAYIDPGSGSAIMSAIIGFFVVIGLTIKSFWYKIKALFTGGSKGDSEADPDA